MYQVRKRDGKIAEFNLSKISEAIRKAFEAQEKNYNQDIIDMLALKVTAAFEPKITDSLISVEDIQDSVESVLIQAGYDDVAKGYILYRKQREKIRNLNSTLLDYKEIVDSYVKVTDWRVKENSTVTYSVGGLNFQQKSENKMRSLISGGTTVLYVSHSMKSIQSLCDRVVWLEHGKVMMVGETEQVCKAYYESQMK